MREARRLRQGRLRTHAERQDHEVGRDRRVPVRAHREAPPVAGLDARGSPRRAAAGRLRSRRCRAISTAISGSSGGITCGSFSSTVTSRPAAHEVLGHLEPDEAAADHDGLAARRLLEPRADAPRVGDGPHHEDAGQIEAAARRDGSAPRPAPARARRRARRARRRRAGPSRGSSCAARSMAVTSCSVRTSMLNRSRKSSREATSSLRSSAMTSPT